MRIWSLTATTMPVALGAVLASQAGHFSWLLVGLMLLCGWFLQLATNLLNTYGDGVSGVDKDKPPCPIPLPVVRRVGYLLLVVGMTLAAIILWFSTWKLLLFAVAGVLGAACYTSRFFVNQTMKLSAAGVIYANIIEGFVFRITRQIPVYAFH